MDKLKESRSKILKMLANGLISIEEAEQLLDALAIGIKFEKTELKGKSFRMLKILILKKDQEKVKFKIPTDFVKVLKTKRFRFDMLGNNIDVDGIIEMVQQGMVGEIFTVETPDGEVIKIIVE